MDAPTPRRRLAPAEPILRRVESASLLDGPGKAIGRAVRTALPVGRVRDTLSGTWLGHALHPMLTDLVLGSWLSATLLDVVGGDRDGRARERLISAGIAAYGPTALTGAHDWADTEPANDAVRRAGLVHAASNLTALGLYGASLAARRRGARGTGALLGAAGATALMAGGFLGGHMSLAKGVGPDQTVFDPGNPEWTPAADASTLPENRPTRVVVEDTPVLLLRREGEVFAIHDRCSHRGCSLSEGEIDGDVVECACHGSRFGLRDGSVHRGPATSPQPAFQVRESDGRIEVRRLTRA